MESHKTKKYGSEFHVKQNKENTKVVEDINKVQKNMSKELTTLEINLEKSDEKLNELETELDELETIVKDLKNQKDDYSIKLQEVEREIIRLDIDAKKETLNQELKFIQDKIKHTMILSIDRCLNIVLNGPEKYKCKI